MPACEYVPSNFGPAALLVGNLFGKGLAAGQVQLDAQTSIKCGDRVVLSAAKPRLDVPTTGSFGIAPLHTKV
jgi:hypothetical protein